MSALILDQILGEFVDEVLNPVFELRDSNESNHIKTGKAVDIRASWLAKVSGKGGWHINPAVREKWAESANVSLLDHLTSVARGAAVLAVMQGESWQASSKNLEQRAVWAMTLGFLHDANKVLDVIQPLTNGGWRSLNALTVDHLLTLWDRLGIRPWLSRRLITPALIKKAGELGTDAWRLLASWMLPCLRLSEAGSTDIFSRPAVGLLARCIDLQEEDLRVVLTAVRWSDRFVGIWLKKGPEGLLDALAELKKSDHQALASTLPEWDVLRVFDPMHPFLLDKLLLNLEDACLERTKWPPLVGTHHDGELVAIVPKAQREIIIADALELLEGDVDASLDVVITTRMGVSVVNGTPSWEDLVAFWQKKLKVPEGRKKVAKLLSVHKKALDNPDKTWSDLDMLARSAEQKIGWRWVTRQELEQGQYDRVLAPMDVVQCDAMVRDLLLAPALATITAMVMSDAPAKMNVPDRKERLKDWLHQATTFGVPVNLPTSVNPTAQVSNVPLPKKEVLSRAVLATITVLMELVVRQPNLDLKSHAHAWFAVAKMWWDGTDGRKGLKNALPPSKVGAMRVTLRQRYESLLNHRPVVVEGKGLRRCLFTDEPLSDDHDSYSQTTGLYGLNISAFNGRSGRPDNLMTAPSAGKNYVSPVSEFEHRLRTKENPSEGKKSDGVALYVASPFRTGLFAGIRPSLNGKNMGNWVSSTNAMAASSNKLRHLSTFKLLKENNQKLDALTAHQVGVAALFEGARLGRYESLPSKVGGDNGQVDFFLRWLRASLRFNRPVHLFRGLPSARKEFFYADCLPKVLINWWDSPGLRLEQIPDHIRRTAALLDVLKTTELGYPWAERLAQKTHRWSTAAFLCDHEGLSLSTHKLLSSMMNTIVKSPSETLLVQMCQEAAVFQSGVRKDASNSVKSMAWDLAWDAFDAHRSLPSATIVSLDVAVVGKIDEDMGRRGNLMGHSAAQDAKRRFAELFVQLVDTLHHRRPEQNTMRMLTGAYRSQLLLENKDRWDRYAAQAGTGESVDHE